jgi:hypothetical protein
MRPTPFMNDHSTNKVRARARRYQYGYGIGWRMSSMIDVRVDRELQFWTTEFGVSEAALTAAVKAVGSSVAAVRQHLRDQARAVQQ